MRYSYSVFLIILIVAFYIFSCTEEERVVIPEIIVSDEIDRITLTGKPAGDQQNYSFEWATTTSGITLKNSDKAVAYFELPEGEDEKLAEINLTISRSKSSKKVYQTIVVPGLTPARAYGLGKQVKAEQSNSREYAWYHDQLNTGTYSLINCGPTAVTMAIKWADPTFTKTPLDARMMFRPAGGWWFTNDIINYLNVHSVDNYTLALTNINVLRQELDEGNIAILCLDMYYVTYSNVSKYRYNKFYTTNAPEWGHFIVIKGYKEVDDTLFFEAYDPYSLGSTYSDGELKGKDRYYTSADLNLATNIWWDFAIIISKESDSGKKPAAVDPTTIEHKSGR